MAIATFITVAFGADGSDAPSRARGSATPTATPADATTPAVPTATLPPSATPAATETPVRADGGLPDRLRGFSYPVAGACLPQTDDLMPGAAREYRDGTHEGVDFYDSDNCTSMGMNTDILAAKAGTVVRADWDYQDLTWEELQELERRVANGEGDDPDVEDVYRGRQVWIDHGDGVVTRYAHLSGIAEGIEVGMQVEQGQVIGYMGESGSPESLTSPGEQVHVHFEIRVDDAYLGLGLSPDGTRRAYEQAFSP